MPIFDTTPSKGSGGGQGGGTTYAAGNGIKIENDVISTKISQQPDNAIGVLDDGLYASIPKPVGIMPLIVIKTVPATPNVQITGKKGNLTVQGTTNEEGIVEISVTEFGVWEFSGFFTDKKVFATLAVNTSQVYNLDLIGVSPIKVFGVKWDTSNSSTKLTRLTTANDPDNVVTVDINSNPKPAVGTGNGESPFDNYAPWNLMEEYNVVNSKITVKRGEQGFSRTTSDVVVYIPEFYYKVKKIGSEIYFYIADGVIEGFNKHPGSGCYVGRYTATSGYNIRSGQTSVVNMTRAVARTNARSKGTGWQLYDYKTYNAIILLYIVEFADWNSQATIGRGYVDNNSGQINTGQTDTMIYHTGRASGTDGKTAIQYRHLENLWGNIYQWVDGVNFDKGNVLVGNTPSVYADDTSTNYSNVGTKSQTDGWISNIGVSVDKPWYFYPTATSGSESAYIPDKGIYGSGWRVLYVGGSWSYASVAGLCSFFAYYASSAAGSVVGPRLLVRPV